MLETLVVAAGVGQIVLALGSSAIPRTLGWRDQLAPLDPLTRRLFWVYAGYILATNLSFGVGSVLLAGDLVNGSPLAAGVTLFIAVYWFSRVAIQFLCFRGLGPRGGFFVAAEIVLVAMFASFTLVYGWAAAVNLGGGVP